MFGFATKRPAEESPLLSGDNTYGSSEENHDDSPGRHDVVDPMLGLNQCDSQQTNSSISSSENGDVDNDPEARHLPRMSDLSGLTDRSSKQVEVAENRKSVYPQQIAVVYDLPLREDEVEIPCKGGDENDGQDQEERHTDKPYSSTYGARTPEGNKRSWLSKMCRRALKRIDSGAVQFAFRLSTGLTLSSLFVLIRTDDFVYPDAMWVLVSVLFVSWFPALDAASVIEKILQRLYGTFFGAFLGLSCGFISLLFPSRTSQCVFLACCMFFCNFGIVFASAQCQVGGVKLIKKYAYATILAVLTFCIALLPFALDEKPKWERAMFRVMNVIVGCALGALTAICVCPKSTMDVLYEKAVRQVKMVGEASDAVLEVAFGVFSGRVQINRLADELLHSRPMEMGQKWKFLSTSSVCSSDSSIRTSASSIRTLPQTDTALRKYDETINDWRMSKLLFPLMKYDPFQNKWNHGRQAEALHTEIARTLARALRIQTTIVVMDGMIRSEAEYDFEPHQIKSFAETGRLIKKMLTLPLNRERSNPAARALFEKLEETRRDIFKASAAVAASEKNAFEDMERHECLRDFRSNLLAGNEENFFDTARYKSGDDLGLGLPIKATGRDDNTMFFLQLVEHLILRSLRLYQAWKHAENIRDMLKADYANKKK